MKSLLVAATAALLVSATQPALALDAKKKAEIEKYIREKVLPAQVAARNRAVRQAAKRKGRKVECTPQMLAGKKYSVCKIK